LVQPCITTFYFWQTPQKLYFVWYINFKFSIRPCSAGAMAPDFSHNKGMHVITIYIHIFTELLYQWRFVYCTIYSLPYNPYFSFSLLVSYQTSWYIWYFSYKTRGLCFTIIQVDIFRIAQNIGSKKHWWIWWMKLHLPMFFLPIILTIENMKQIDILRWSNVPYHC